MKELQIHIRLAQPEDIPALVSAFAAVGWQKPAATFEKYLDEQKSQKRQMWIALKEGEIAGYVTLKWHSDYAPFAHKGIPEINDLNVVPPYQKTGIGSALLKLAETEARMKSQTVGIGVGLTSDYGAAQILYIKRGYVPDGKGITYKGKPVTLGEKCPVDDDLVLWLVKQFS